MTEELLITGRKKEKDKKKRKTERNKANVLYTVTHQYGTLFVFLRKLLKCPLKKYTDTIINSSYVKKK